MDSLAGHLLIAAPGMVDDFFSLTVVLLFQHSEEGAAGVILNKPTNIVAQTVWEELQESNPHASAPISIGGPCEGPLIAVHNSLAYAEYPVIPGVALTFESDSLKKLIRQPEQSIRLISGYSGWGPDQLENEIRQGGWYSIPARPHTWCLRNLRTCGVMLVPGTASKDDIVTNFPLPADMEEAFQAD